DVVIRIRFERRVAINQVNADVGKKFQVAQPLEIVAEQEAVHWLPLVFVRLVKIQVTTIITAPTTAQTIATPTSFKVVDFFKKTKPPYISGTAPTMTPTIFRNLWLNISPNFSRSVFSLCSIFPINDFVSVSIFTDSSLVCFSNWSFKS